MGATKDKLYSLLLPYANPKRNTIIKLMNNNMKQIFANNVKTRITYTSRKRGTKFQIKYLTKSQHEYDLTYYSKWRNEIVMGII